MHATIPQKGAIGIQPPSPHQPEQPRLSEVDNSCDNAKQVDAKQKLLDYHRKAMEARRSLQYQGFVALLGFYVVFLKAMESFSLFVDDLGFLRVVVTFVIALIFVLFLFFAYQIELRNAADRQKYSYLETDIWQTVAPKHEFPTTSRKEMLGRSWATTWPILMMGVLVCSLIVLVWVYRPIQAQKSTNTNAPASEPMPPPDGGPGG